MDEKTSDEKKQTEENGFEFELEPEHDEPGSSLEPPQEKAKEMGLTLEPVEKPPTAPAPDFKLEPAEAPSGTPREKTGFTLEPSDKETETAEEPFSLEPPEEASPAEEPVLDLEPPREEPAAEDPVLDLEPPKDKSPAEQPQLDLEPPEEDSPAEEPVLDLEPPREDSPVAPEPKKQETGIPEKIVVETEPAPDDTNKEQPKTDKKDEKPERGISRRFDPRKTKVKEHGEEKFEPQIAFAKGIAQDGPPPKTPADLLKNPKMISTAAATVVIVAALLFFLLKPEPEPIPTPKPTPKKEAVQKQKVQKPAPEKKPVQMAPVQEEPPEISYEAYADNAFSMRLPAGYKTVTDPGAGLNKRFFLYGKTLKVQILYWEQAGGWDAEEMMYNKIEKIQKTKNSADALRVNSYHLATIDGCRGYEITMSGLRNYTYSRAKTFAFYKKGKIFLIDIDCKDPKNPDTLKMFDALSDSIKKTLHVH